LAVAGNGEWLPREAAVQQGTDAPARSGDSAGRWLPPVFAGDDGPADETPAVVIREPRLRRPRAVLAVAAALLVALMIGGAGLLLAHNSKPAPATALSAPAVSSAAQPTSVASSAPARPAKHAVRHRAARRRPARKPAKPPARKPAPRPAVVASAPASTPVSTPAPSVQPTV